MSLFDLFQTPAPDVAIEIDHGHVAAARVSWRGGQPAIAAYAGQMLPEGLVVPGLAAQNITDVPALSRIVADTLAELGGSRPTRVSLIVPDTVAKWTKLNGCAAPARKVLQANGAFCEVYASCGGAPVQLCVTETGGHSWPGGNKRRAEQPPSQAISANDVMWEFFSRHAAR